MSRQGQIRLAIGCEAASGHGRTGRTDLQLRYLDDVLQRIATDAGYAPVGWGAAEVTHFRLFAQCAGAAIAESDLHALRLLRLRPGTDDNHASVLLSTTRVLMIQFEMTATSVTAVLSVSTAETENR